MEKNEYRIVEYKDCFIIEEKIFDDFSYIPFWRVFLNFITKKRVFFWVKVKTETVLKTKEECLVFIAEHKRYPIIHEVK